MDIHLSQFRKLRKNKIKFSSHHLNGMTYLPHMTTIKILQSESSQQKHVISRQQYLLYSQTLNYVFQFSLLNDKAPVTLLDKIKL